MEEPSVGWQPAIGPADKETLTGRPETGRQQRPQHTLQPPGGDHHRRTVTQRAGQRRHQGFLQCGRSMVEHLSLRPASESDGSPDERVGAGRREMIRPLSDRRGRSQVMQLSPAIDHGDREQRLVDLEVLDKCRLLELLSQVRNRAGRRGSLDRTPSPSVGTGTRTGRRVAGRGGSGWRRPGPARSRAAPVTLLVASNAGAAVAGPGMDSLPLS